MSTAIANTATANPFAVLGGAGTTAAPADSTASADRFLTMLVTQLQNQDPLNPMDNAQITSQMAQINAVTGLDKVNESVKALNAQLLQMQAWQGASLVGRDVLVPGDALALRDGSGRGVVELAGAATAAQVQVLDNTGRVVGSVDLGALDAGRVPFEFELGSLPADRAYRFRVVAVDGKDAVATRTLAFDRVQSVSTAGDTLTLSLARSGELPVGQVLAFN